MLTVIRISDAITVIKMGGTTVVMSKYDRHTTTMKVAGKQPGQNVAHLEVNDG